MRRNPPRAKLPSTQVFGYVQEPADVSFATCEAFWRDDVLHNELADRRKLGHEIPMHAILVARLSAAPGSTGAIFELVPKLWVPVVHQDLEDATLLDVQRLAQWQRLVAAPAKRFDAAAVIYLYEAWGLENEDRDEWTKTGKPIAQCPKSFEQLGSIFQHQERPNETYIAQAKRSKEGWAPWKFWDEPAEGVSGRFLGPMDGLVWPRRTEP